MDPTCSIRRLLEARDNVDGGQKLLDLLKDPFAAQLQIAGIYSALGTSVGFTVFIAICFSFLRPYNQAVYAPKLKHADEKHAPPPIGKKPWSWVMPLVTTSETALIEQIGMDATIFLRFIRMCRNMFLVLTLIGVGILLPINASKAISDYHVDEKRDDKGQSDGEIPWLFKITPLHVWGPPQWAQVIVAYLFNAVIMGFLWWNYNKITVLRRRYFKSVDYQNSLHSRTLMLYDIPKKKCTDEGIAEIIDAVASDASFARTAIARNVRELPDLIDEHDRAVRKLEKVLAKYLQNPAQLPAARPLCKPSKKDPSYGTYTAGQKIDAIEYYTNRIHDLETRIKEIRATIDRRSAMQYGFASYSDIAEAHHIAYYNRKKKPQGATIKLAPRPADIIWRNMSLSSSLRSRRRWANSLWITLLTLLWIGPNAMIAIFLVNLGNLGKVWPAFQRSLERDTKFWGIVQGIASPAVMSLVYLALPVIFRRLSIKAGDQTKTGRERHVLAKLFAFFVFNNLIVFSIFSAVYSFIYDLVEGKSDSQTRNAWDSIWEGHFAEGVFQSLCSNSPFWITYLLQRQLGAAADLAQLWPLIQAFFKKKFSNPTPRELIELTAPPPFEYASYYNYFLFYATVTLCFAGIQPLVLPATALYFCIDTYLKKYLILYRFVTKTESGGLFWRVLFNRFIFATILSNLVVMLTCWMRGEGTHVQFYAACPLPLTMIAFKFYCRGAFDDKIRYYTTRSPRQNPEEGNLKETQRRNDKLASKFGHPALYKKLITPMVHQKAQNMLHTVYSGRLTDGREGGATDLMSVSGYSDVYALDSMQGGRPGKAAHDVPGFEFVPESHMDFEYYKNRAEFTEQHGGGEMYGRLEDMKRSGTPASFDELTDPSYSRPGTAMSGRSTPFGPGNQRRVMTNPNMPDTSYQSFRPAVPQGYTNPSEGDFRQPMPIGSDQFNRGRSPLYEQDNDSASGLVSNAAQFPTGSGAYGSRETSVDRGQTASGMTPGTGSPFMTPGPSIGALGGGPQGYSGLAQAEDADNQDPSQYSYFRQTRKPVRRPGEGW